MVVISRVARVVVVAALLWSLGCFAAAVNWHSNWRLYEGSGGAGSDLAAQAQERWQYWVDMSLLGVLVAVACMVLVLWQVFRAAGRIDLDPAPTEAERLEKRGR